MIWGWLIPVAAGAAEDMSLTAKGFYRSLTPASLRETIGGRSLSGVSAETGPGTDDFVGFTPLMRAASETPYPEVIDILIKAGCDGDAVAYRRWVFEQQDPIKLSLYPHTPITFAVENPNPEVLSALLRHHPKSVADGEISMWTALATAARKGKHAHFSALVSADSFPRPDAPEAGAQAAVLWGILVDINRPENTLVVDPVAASKMAETLIRAGYIPAAGFLRRALSAGQNDVALQIIRAGVSPKGKDLLWEAVYRYPFDKENHLPDPSPELIAQLLNYNDPNVGPEPPLLVACRLGVDVRIVKMLVAAGAKPDFSKHPFASKHADALLPDALLEAVLSSARDNPALVACLLELGIVPSALREPGLLVQASKWPVPKPESAIVLIRAGADPRELRADPSTREFGRMIGVLDEDGIPCVRYAPSPAFVRGLAHDKKMMMAWAFRNRRKALVDRGFYRVADVADVRRVIGRMSLDKKFEEDFVTYGAYGILYNLFGIQPRKKVSRREVFPLMEAAMATDHPGVIALLAKAGADVNARNAYALDCAMENPNPAILEALLRLKPDIGKGLGHHLWLSDALPEHIAVLVAEGVDLNTDIPLALISEALHYDNLPVARALLRAGADPDKTDQDGERALFRAVSGGHYDFALSLIEAGADPVFDGPCGRSFLKILERSCPKADDEKGKADYRHLREQVKAAYGSRKMTSPPGN
ncbi:ankyrin repeat domain-containing protein [Desulfosarcina sp. OttesenSCG-928-A07]|nr:ankyrin repeat domain-containing protein [Desulfosarcina sp. OttesenSCG-928-A07]